MKKNTLLLGILCLIFWGFNQETSSYTSILTQIHNFYSIKDNATEVKSKFSAINGFQFTFNSNYISTSEYLVAFVSTNSSAPLKFYLIGDEYDEPIGTGTITASNFIEGTVGSFSAIPPALISTAYADRISSWNTNKNTLLDTLVANNELFNRFYIPTNNLRNTTYQAFFAIINRRGELIADIILYDTDSTYTGDRVQNYVMPCPRLCPKGSRIYQEVLSL